MIISFIFFLSIFICIGVLSTLANKHTNQDYFLASQGVKPWLVALSAVATNNSGFMFIGMIGCTYTQGLSSIWLMVGLIGGDFIASFFIHKKLRVKAQNERVLSFAGVISKWGNFNYTKLRAYLGTVTIVFLGTYAAGQLNAGSKALHVLFGWDYKLGAIIGAIILLLYCFSGGIRASIWTDAAQSFVMIFAMGLLCIVSIIKIGGVSELIFKLQNISDDYTCLFTQNLHIGSVTGPFLFILGWILAGIGVIGQPQIMVRFMAMDRPDNMFKVRVYYYSLFTLFSILTIMVGAMARILLPDIDHFDAELALPKLADALLPEVLIGLVLAGLFAATMSTADSQVLSCSAAVTSDFTGKKKPSYLITKLSTVFVTFIALMIALYGSKSVFSLMLVSWSALGASFAPLLIIYAFNGRPSERLSIAIASLGTLGVVIWKLLGWENYFYEIAPGMILGFCVFFCSKLFVKKERVIN
ncbi:sodium:proline symporter [PVC group bacterium (ex Bugula neritina AB1)]|nr:sodium:proline symporter [PVC group bacterium (ex Bugula neritina AB1)]